MCECHLSIKRVRDILNRNEGCRLFPPVNVQRNIRTTPNFLTANRSFIVVLKTKNTIIIEQNRLSITH